MGDRDVLVADLQATREALTRQLDTIGAFAEQQGIPRESMQDVGGAFIAAPVLVALTQVQIALLGITPETVDEPGTIGPTGATLCMANSRDELGGWWCSLPKRHDGAHRAYYGHDATGELCCEWSDDDA